MSFRNSVEFTKEGLIVTGKNRIYTIKYGVMISPTIQPDTKSRSWVKVLSQAPTYEALKDDHYVIVEYYKDEKGLQIRGRAKITKLSHVLRNYMVAMVPKIVPVKPMKQVTEKTMSAEATTNSILIREAIARIEETLERLEKQQEKIMEFVKNF